MNHEPTASIVGILGTVCVLAIGYFVFQDWAWYVYLIAACVGYLSIRSVYVDTKKKSNYEERIHILEEKVRSHEKKLKDGKMETEDSIEKSDHSS